ncbi:hypothetical protein [Paenibacillus agaridevorans]|uniref:hypothetical protein n=1 Tax=Paenibacillus agaridevorans TaxID=171404 RepID=UPI001BE47F19|nr:hypothetical protein [Paenibacillus agaridevorans]
MHSSQSTTVSRCSLVIRTTDVWTGRPAAASAVRVRLEDVRATPLRTSEGSWAFLDIHGNFCTIIVESDMYLPCARQVDLSTLKQGHPVVELFLMPNRRYTPPASASGIIRRLTDGAGKPLSDVEVFAYVEDDSMARGRILDEEVAPGSTKLRCLPGATKLKNGDALAVRGKDGKGAECFRVLPTEDGEELRLELDRPTAGRWKRHTLLLPAAAAVSDRDGWVLLPFRGRVSPVGGVAVRLKHEDRTLEERWPLEQGKTNVLPDYVWAK